jgi:hypothetical protein
VDISKAIVRALETEGTKIGRVLSYIQMRELHS